VVLLDGGGARAAELALWLRQIGYDAGYLVGGMARWMGDLATGDR
jgi:rhodanese-related sulfurtransferase